MYKCDKIQIFNDEKKTWDSRDIRTNENKQFELMKVKSWDRKDICSDEEKKTNISGAEKRYICSDEKESLW